ncbi:serine hydrolase [Paenibacillus sp. GSMTC-2017]|uniref:serine hydrolase n=1 Tax=Paenibacillus sp. GSMTC-2017 TaxID=2794350 RepID=UPI0018D84492|nr:serine hydrolase [Paenibacillus sp. GSMTC-2017]MBH5319826.1 serine hydrolase [Paenibacillus sp. GSMTC-2017]
MKKIMMLLLAVTLLLQTAFISADPKANDDAVKLDKRDVRAFAKQFFEQKEIADQLAGAVLVVVKDGEVLLNEGYGYADIATKKPVDPHKTVFRIASVTKLITAVGIMQLAETGKVDLNKDVQTYLPDTQIPNKTGFPLTLKHLLTHTSGFDNGTAADPNKQYSLEQYVKDTMSTVVVKPGEEYNYNNFGYDLQGYVIEKVSALSYEDYLNKHLFDPLGMANSSLIFSEEVKEVIATPYNGELKQAEHTINEPINMPKGGMFSTGTDMANFLLAMVNGGKFGGERILTETSVKEMVKRQVTIHPELPGVGYGFETLHSQSYNGHKVVEKLGDLPGFHSNLWLLPDQNTGMFIAFNSDKGNLRIPFIEQFMNRYFPDTGNKPTFITPAPTKGQLLRFEGQYNHLRNPARNFSITATEGSLIVEDSSGTHILRQASDMLFYDEEGNGVGFKVDGNGDISYFSNNKTGSWYKKMLKSDMHLFNDVPSDHPYATYIYGLVKAGVLKGVVGSFEPAKAMTRGQFMGLIIPLSTYPITTHPSTFVDTKGHLFEQEIQTALEIGIIQGYSGSTFGPDKPLSREQAASILWRLVRILLVGATPEKVELKGPFSSWASEGIQYVVGNQLHGPDVKVATGPIDYRAKDNMLNQEVAAMLYRLLQEATKE